MLKRVSQIPHVKILFNDNPYLLKDYTQFDFYSLNLPVHLYLKDKNNYIHTYSLFDNYYRYLDNKEVLKDPVYNLFDKVKFILEKYTINNQNINIKDAKLELILRNKNIHNFNHFPMYIYPDQHKVNQYHNYFRVVKSPYDIKTLLTLNNTHTFISDMYKKIDVHKL